MIFEPTPLEGAFVLNAERHEDERGFFARRFCARAFAERGLEPTLVQGSVSFNTRSGTLRGLHYQASPCEEAKTVYCLSGAIWDVIVDLRPDSATRYRWFAVELRAETGRGLHIPRGFAHGFITLEEGSTVEYLISSDYVPEAARGIRWDDPTLAIAWPRPPAVISARDRALAPLNGALHDGASAERRGAVG